MRKLLREGKAELELAVTKCLTGAKLTPAEVNEVCALGESDLMRDFGCDIYMAETVKLHSKYEMFRLRAQNQFTKIDGLMNDTGYPTKPYSKTAYIKESKLRLKEAHHSDTRSDQSDNHDKHGRMLDYGHSKSDSEEGRMMKQALRDVAVDAYRLHQMLEDGDDIPQWCQYKAAQAQQMVGSVRDYIEYKLERMGDERVGEEEMFDPEEMAEDFGDDSAEMAMDFDDYDDDEDLSPDFRDQMSVEISSEMSDESDEEGYDSADVKNLSGERR